MATWIELCWRYPDLPIIVREAAGCADWARQRAYRAQVRSLGMSPVELELALGILASAFEEGVQHAA